MNKFLITLAAIIGIGGGEALAHEVAPAHYHVGETQLFRGIVCKSQEPIMHIFNTWMEVDLDLAKETYRVYASVDECRYLVGYSAYFVEKIISSIATGSDYQLTNALVFAISPNEGSEIVDYLLTWENLGENA